MAIFNKCAYLNRSLFSCIEQTLKNIEVIVVDDGSFDNTSKILAKFQKQDKRIKIYQHKNNKGTLAARITGILNANGYFSLVLDPDDSLDISICQIAYHFANKLQADILEYGCLNIYPNKQVGNCWIHRIHNYSKIELMDNFRKGKLNCNLARHLIKTTIYKKSIQIIKEFFPDYNLVYDEDRLQFGLIILFVNQMYFLNYLGYYRFANLSDSSHTQTYQTKSKSSLDTILVKKVLSNFKYSAVF